MCLTTTTVNFLSDGTQPYRRPGKIDPTSFTYLSYRDVSIEATVSNLIGKFRTENEQVKGVTMIREVGKGMWRAGVTILMNTAMAQKTLAEVGWRPEINPVWLAVRG